MRLILDRYNDKREFVETLFEKEFPNKWTAISFVNDNYLRGFGMAVDKRTELAKRNRVFFSYPRGYFDDEDGSGILGFKLHR